MTISRETFDAALAAERERGHEEGREQANDTWWQAVFFIWLAAMLCWKIL